MPVFTRSLSVQQAVGDWQQTGLVPVTQTVYWWAEVRESSWA